MLTEAELHLLREFSEQEAKALRRYADEKMRGNVSKIIRSAVTAAIANDADNSKET